MCNKKDVLRYFVKENQTDILMLTETWLNQKFNSTLLLNLNKFSIYRKDRAAHGGGVLIAVKNNIKVEEVQLNTKNEILCLNIYLYKNPFLLIVVYLPHCIDYQLKSFFKKIENIIKNRKNFAIIGDFNLPIVKWDEIFLSDCKIHKIMEKFFINNQPLTQHVLHATRNNHILDLLFTRNIEIINLEIDEPFSSSDHNTINFKLNRNFTIIKTQLIPNWKKSDFKKIYKCYLHDNIHQKVCGAELAIDKWNIFKNFLKNSIVLYVPLTKIFDDSNKILNSDFKRLRRKAKNLENNEI